MKALVVKRTDPGRWDLVFAYWEDGAPLSDKRIGVRLYDALARISITEEEQDRRNITGHKTAQMTNHYTRPNVADMTAITELQKDLVKPTK